MYFSFVLLCSLLAGSVSAAENSAALYDPVAPPDAAFIRVFNLSDTAVDVLAQGKSQPQTVGAGSLGPYLFVKPGSHKVAVSAASTTLTLAAKDATTLIYQNGALLAIVDGNEENKKKALVNFYNLTDQAVALKTADGKHAVVDALNQNQTGSRLINELKIQLAAFSGSSNVGTFQEVYLKKGRSYSYFVLPDNGAVKTLVQPNSVDIIE